MDEGNGLIPGLPDDLAINCIARVPTVFHATLSLVCRSWKFLIESPLLFAVRRDLNLQQELLIVVLRTHGSDQQYHWYCLHEHGEERRSFAVMPRMPVEPKPVGTTVAVAGNKVLVLGGSVNEVARTTSWSYDPVRRQWEALPRMRVAREFCAAGTIGGKVYVMGGCQVSSWSGCAAWAEVFDTATGVWSAVPSPPEMRERWMHGNAVLEGKLFAMADKGGIVYEPMSSRWSYVSTRLDAGWRGRAAVVDDILYSYDFLGKIQGYDPRKDRWHELKGVQKSLPRFLSGATLANVAGKLYVVWEGQGAKKQTEFLCAAVEVKKEANGDLTGRILWCQVIFRVPRGTSIVHCLSLAF